MRQNNHPLINVTPEQCELMYQHYDQRLQDPGLPQHQRVWIEVMQSFWVTLHEGLVPFATILDLNDLT